MNILYVLLLSIFISVIYSQNPSTLTFTVQVYDQFPQYNNNFETNCNGGVIPGMIKPNLNVTSRVPELVSLVATDAKNAQGCMKNPALFKYFFAPQQNAALPGLNSPLNLDLVFTYDTARQIYVYNNQNFFPIDGKGFDVDPAKRIYNNNGVYHNYHFCMRMSTLFTYKGFEVFNFVGDDDVWVFINNKLAIDLGGVHTPAAGSVDTRTLGLTIGQNYNFDLFFCERQRVGSTIKIETNLLFVCPWKDFCGVCQGDGSSCCNPLTTCNDNNACTIDTCPAPNATIVGPIANNCGHKAKTDPNPVDICINRVCNPATGNFDPTPVQCLNRTNECLNTLGCNSTVGCQYRQFCNDNICNVKDQCANGKCVPVTCTDRSNECLASLGCDSTKGCQYESTCNKDICNVKDQCANGKCVPVQCADRSNECLASLGCNSTTGCQYESTCNDNICNVKDQCSNGTCVPVTCPDRSDECLVSLGCDSTKGCQYEPACNSDICNVKDQCSNGTCVPVTCADRSNECLVSLGCNSATGCQYESTCNDDICNVKDQCANGTCVPVQCADRSDECLVSLGCNSTTGCQYESSCNNDICFVRDQCANGTCVPVQCPDRSDECLVSLGCDSTKGCQYESVCNSDICNARDQCSNGTCVPLQCADRSDECLISLGCNSTTGCQYQSTCNDNVCNVQNQCANGTCIPKSAEDCAIELDGFVNPCKIYSCDASGNGCKSEDKCKPSTNPCILTSCNATSGECFNTEIPGDICDCGCGEIPNKCMKSFCTKDGVCQPKFRDEINDNNFCTLDVCDPCTGTITHTPAPQCLSCQQCSA
ncbi:PA14 domain-containing protein [Heterostelium album PN500]|uniref:PA14 domain-containing protein n=1 Tax=Heterostelium pallidum (strain ATCC 26659 / Pp 5 / PN500) TaxID=670386 RepID=D3B8B9_HETP5|nr:PA14 domain-containing protein [Heterostelium album PN500]EFA82287.1 PA14 domain-containing protein [Heterostelium album PN500]|eukprot:XP_020434404.1 PA14 domain-containing protein [Heterostelium album PN500]